MKDHTLAALAVALVCLVSVSTALSFDSSPNQIKCFREQLSRHQVVSGEVGGTSSPFQTLKFWVENSFKRTVFNADDVPTTTKFSFAADVDGEFKFCFMDNTRMGGVMGGMAGIGGRTMPRRILFNYKIEDDKSKEYKAPTKAGLKPLEAELQRIEQVAVHVSTETDHQREREATHRDTSETLNSRVAWYSILSLFCLVALSGAQVFYIQRYLKKTKWID
jgi:hypothetical protein